MEIRVFGPLEASVDGRPVPLGGAKPRALFAMLALDAGSVVSVERLIVGLWGERPPATATKLVQLYVSQLRRALAAGGDGGLIVTRGRGYELRVDPDAVDAARFELLVARGSPREALGLWRGPPLDDLADEPFAAAEIRRLEDLRLAALELAIERDLDAGRHRDVVGELDSLVAAEPLRERLHAQRMLALYRCGRQADALDAYRQARAGLVDAIGVEPGPELRRLQEAILVQDPALEAPPAASPAEEPRPGLSHEADAPAPLVGRAREMNALLSGLEQVLTGQGQLFLLVGEAGIGKSRLSDELAGHACERGAEVLFGRCWEAGGAPAYWPWVQALRAHVRDRDPDALRLELGAGAAEVAQLLPELRELFADLPDPPLMSPEAARFRLFEKLASFLVRAAGSQPLVLMLDDLHAADEPSLLLLQFVAGQLREAPLLIVGAYRDVDVEPDTPLASVVADLLRERVTHVLALAGLSEAEVGQMIESSAGMQPPQLSVAAIHHRTEGNPLFVGELVRLLSSERLAQPAEAAVEALPIPPGVREVIGRRLRLLPGDSRPILALAAVLGREFEFGALSHVSGLSEEHLLEMLEEAIRVHVLAEVPAAPGRLRFAHALIRDTLYGELGGLRRLRLHSEVGEALEAFYGENREPHLAELAHHFHSAGAAGNAAKAIEYARAAGDRAVRVLAFEEAVRLYAMALDALARDPFATDRTRCQLLVALADAESRAGDDLAAKATYLRAAELAKLTQLPELLGRAAAGYGGRFLWARAATDAQLVPLLEDALAALGDADSILRVQLLSRLATALCDDPSRERRERVWEQAHEAARRLGDPATLAYALDAGIAATEGPHKVKQSLTQADEVISLAARIGDRERAFGGHEHAFWCSWQLGDGDRRAAELAAVTRVAQELQQPAQLWLATAAQAALALSEGRFDEAEGLSERAGILGERAQSWNATATRKLQLFVLRRERGQLDGFEQEIRDFPHEFPSPLVHRCVLAYAYARLDATAEATAEVKELVRHDLSSWHVDSEWLFSITLLAEAGAMLGHGRHAAPLYDVLLPYGSLNAVAPIEAALGSASRALGMLATVLGRFADAARHYEEALRMNTRMGARPWVAHAEHDYARMLVARGEPGDRERALELTSRSLERYRALGMESFATEATLLERALGAAGADESVGKARYAR
jgi:DNA-binding SARP family transcriptional activator/tetratricopeptide (TPR) repeat protein